MKLSTFHGLLFILVNAKIPTLSEYMFSKFWQNAPYFVSLCLPLLFYSHTSDEAERGRNEINLQAGHFGHCRVRQHHIVGYPVNLAAT